MTKGKEINKDLVISHLDKILQTPPFIASPRARNLLHFVVTETLAGRGERLKGYVIAMAVFGRDESFDPATDSIVRVHAGRLRQMLERYYANEGKNDILRIELRKGGYVPLFRKVEKGKDEKHPNEPASDTDTESARTSALPHPPFPALRATSWQKTLGLFVLFLAVLVGWRILDLPLGGTETRSIEGPSHHTIPFHGPRIAILSCRNPTHSEKMAQFCRQMTQRVSTELSRFKGLLQLQNPAETVALARAGMKTAEDTTDDPVELGRRLGVNYVLDGQGDMAGNTLRLTARLLDVSTGAYVWSEYYDYSLADTSLMAVQDEVANRIAATLGQPYGVLMSRELRGLENHPLSALTPYQCVLHSYRYMAEKTPQRHAEARDCLERSVKKDPTYAMAWAMLSWLYGDEKRLKFNLRGSERQATIRAIEAARQAVFLEPQSAAAHQYLALAYFYSGAKTQAQEQIEHAMRLNPNDGDIYADAGWFHWLSENYEEGVALIRKAIELNPGHPSWYRFILIADYFRRGDYDKAWEEMKAYFDRGGPLRQVLNVAILVEIGQKKEAKALLKAIFRANPVLKTDPAYYLRRWQLPERFIQKVLASLAKTGFEVSTAAPKRM